MSPVLNIKSPTEDITMFGEENKEKRKKKKKSDRTKERKESQGNLDVTVSRERTNSGRLPDDKKIAFLYCIVFRSLIVNIIINWKYESE